MKKIHNLKLFGLVALLAFALVFIGIDFIEGQVRTTRGKPENPPGNPDNPNKGGHKTQDRPADVVFWNCCEDPSGGDRSAVSDTSPQIDSSTQTNTSQFANAKEKLISMGFNVPSESHKQEFVGSIDIPIDIKDRFFEILDAITSVLGSYPNFVYVAYNRNGTEADARPVFDRLSAIDFSLDEFTIAELQRKATCLGGSNAGEPRTVTTEPYSVCIQHLAFIQNPFDHPPQETKAHPDRILGRRVLNYAHEYFHHYERAHALDRGLNYQGDLENPQTTVDAPPWWTEGAAVAFQNAWYKANWSTLSFFEGKKWEDVKVSIMFSDDPGVYKEFRRGIMDAPGRKREGCTPNFKMGPYTDRYDTERAPDADPCRAFMLAVPYIASLTSYKTVLIDIPQDYYDLGFWGAFEKHVGMNKQEFYDNFNAFLRSGNPEDEPPEGWAPPEGDIASYANFLEIVPKK